MNDTNRQRIQRAIDALQLVADDQQDHLNQVVVFQADNPAWPGQILKLGRTVDTLERSITDLQRLLDAPSRPDLQLVQGDPGQARQVA
jgi:hypothetical protein